jgi:single-strand DNA-binding protein
MAAISLGGKVTCKEGSSAVQLRTFDNGGQLAKFSVVDQEYFYVKQGEERKGQFYSVEVNGKQAEIVAERLQRGDRVCVRGQLVQRDYNDRTYLDVKNASVTFMEARREESSAAFGASNFDEAPF